MAGVAEPHAQEAWTLRRCVEHAVEHNISVRQYENAVERQRVQLSTARNQRLPNLLASASENINFGRSLTIDNTYANKTTNSTSFSLDTSVPLFTGFSIPNNVKLNRLNLAAATADLEKAKNDIRVQVAQAYVQILYSMEISEVAHRQVAIDSQQVARLQALYDVGKASEAQLSQQKASLAQGQLTATQADNSLQLALLSLSQLLELPSPEGFTIVKPVVDDTALQNKPIGEGPEAIYAEAVGTRPEVEAQQLRLKVADRNIALAKANLYPQLSFYAGLGTNYFKTSGMYAESFGSQMKHNFSQYLGLNLSYTIFNRLQTRNSIRTARIDYQNQLLALDNTKKTLYKEIQQVYYNTVAARQKLVSSQQAQVSAGDAFRLTTAKYEQGKANITEFNEAKNNYLKTESDLTQARYEFLYQQALILFYRGQELKF